MRIQQLPTPQLGGPANGGSVSMAPALGVGPKGDKGDQGNSITGPQGPPGPGTGAGAWQATTAYTANQVVQAPDGSMIRRVSTGTSRATFDATEKTLWVAVLATPGTIEADALISSIDARVPVADTTTPGKVELATTAEVKTGTDTTRAVTTRAMRDTLRLSTPRGGAIAAQHAWAATTPSITVSAVGAATTISNPTSVLVNTVAKVRTSGAPTIGAAVAAGGSGNSYYGTGLTGSGVDFPGMNWETMLYGQYLEWEVDAGRAVKMYVDGRLVKDEVTYVGVGGSAGKYRVKVDCGTVGVHHVRMFTNALVQNVVYDGTLGTIWAPTTPLPITEFYLGDSWCQGYGSDNVGTASYTPAGIASYCSDLLGTTALVGGQSGTGYTNNAGGGSGQTTFPNRVVPSIVPRNPDRVIVVGSVNDAAASASAVGTAAATTYANLASNLPDAEVIVFGIQYPTAKIGDATYNAIDDAIAAAAAAAPNVRAFVSMRNWGIPSGFMRGDAVHMTSAGYKYVGSRMAHEIAAVTKI